MREKIIELLNKKQDYVSGDQIASRLGISRQALWKHIQELKEAGYEIVAVPHLGYKLEAVPDRLFSFEIHRDLGTKSIGRNIHYFESVGSTMEEAMRLGLAGQPEGTLVVAETQTKGKGRLGRSWFSPKHKGIYFSLILRPKVLPQGASILTLLAAVSICEAIGQSTGIDARIKWPNDIFVHNKKLGGILTELVASLDEIDFVVIGIGLNVNNDARSLPAAATSLKEEKKEQLGRVYLLQELLRRIEANYLALSSKGTDFLIHKWREYNITLNRRVKVHCHKTHVEGEAVDIDKDGGLLIRKDSGLVEKIMAGDVVHCR